MHRISFRNLLTRNYKLFMVEFCIGVDIRFKISVNNEFHSNFRGVPTKRSKAKIKNWSEMCSSSFNVYVTNNSRYSQLSATTSVPLTSVVRFHLFMFCFMSPLSQFYVTLLLLGVADSIFHLEIRLLCICQFVARLCSWILSLSTKGIFCFKFICTVVWRIVNTERMLLSICSL